MAVATGISASSTGPPSAIRRSTPIAPAGLPIARPAGLQGLREALIRAWTTICRTAAIGQPVADLLDTVELRHPRPKPARRLGAAPGLAEIEGVIRACGAHLLRSYRDNGFIPTYAAFNLIGDPDCAAANS